MASRATAPSPTWNPCNSHTGIAHYQLRTNAEMFKILEPDLAKIWCDPSPVNARIEAVLPAAARDARVGDSALSVAVRPAWYHG